MRIATFVAAVLVGAHAATPGKAQADAATAICSDAGISVAAGDAPLNAAADRGEALIARLAGTSNTALDAGWLGEPVAPGVSASSIARARYCAAAGETMRLSSEGNPAQAKAFLLTAARLAGAANDRGIAATAAYRLALASLSVETIAGAGTRGAKSVRVADVDPPAPVPNDDPCAAVVDGGFARIPAQFAARVALGCALVRARAAGDGARAALAALRLSRLGLSQLGGSGDGTDQFRREIATIAIAGLGDARTIADPALRATMIGRLAEAAIDAGAGRDISVGQAVASLGQDRADPASQAFAAALSGRLAAARGDRIAAAQSFQRAVFFESQRSQPLMMPTWLLLLADAEPARREAITLQAYRALESIRPLVPANDPITEESSFALRMRPVFEAAVAVELQDGDTTRAQARIASAQQIVEAYRQAELQSAFGSNCVPPRDPVDPSKLRAGEVLLYPILLKDRVELIYVAGGAGGVSNYARLPSATPIARAAVAQLVDEMVSSASLGGDESWRTASRALYDLSVKPIEARLAPGGTLVIVPDGPLRSLPFAALLDGEGKYLIERTRLAVVPALAYSQPGSDRTSRPLSVVAASLQREVSLPAGVFAKLEGTADEASVAAGTNGKFIPDFREADLRRALAGGRVDVLHLATHAAFNGRSDRSFIVANDEAIPLADLRGLIGGNQTRGDELDLLVLSACETAVGDDAASMGLAGAAVQSGAESALASLWSVSDTGTVALMKNFYGAYRGGAGKAAALRDAQLAMIGGGGDFARPGIWAAFVLLGGWR